MSKYKLIKEYPNSPILGTITDFNVGWGCTENWVKENPDKASEFWKKVGEKEYEVLKFQIDSSIFEYYPKEKSEYKWKNFNGNWTWSYIPVEAKLISVKRLSDGEIFTVGDKVEHKGVSTFTITHMRIHEETLQISSGFGIVVSINEIEHQKRPLFITEDKVEMFIGSQVYIVNNHAQYLGPNFIYKFIPLIEGYKYFSTKKAAEKWVEENKPKYSESKINKAINNLFSPELKNDNHIFAKAIIEGYTEAFFKELNNDT